MDFANTTPASKPFRPRLSAGVFKLRLSLILALHREALTGIAGAAYVAGFAIDPVR
jgi:hypothetical protein